MTTRVCPEIPEIDPQFPPAGPLKCAGCGNELRITCGNDGCPPPLGPRNQVGHGVHRGAHAGKGTPRTYKPKTCACGAEFTPTGPRDTACAACKAKR